MNFRSVGSRTTFEMTHDQQRVLFDHLSESGEFAFIFSYRIILDFFRSLNFVIIGPYCWNKTKRWSKYLLFWTKFETKVNKNDNIWEFCVFLHCLKRCTWLYRNNYTCSDSFSNSNLNFPQPVADLPYRRTGGRHPLENKGESYKNFNSSNDRRVKIKRIVEENWKI